jgi:hypothetical protein
MKFKKKAVVIEAVQWTGENVSEILEFTNHMDIRLQNHEVDGVERADLFINTLKGTMHASEGDWVIKGVHGEFYPCKPDIFEETYEPAE